VVPCFDRSFEETAASYLHGRRMPVYLEGRGIRLAKMGRTCSVHHRLEMHTTFWAKNHKRGALDMNGRISYYQNVSWIHRVGKAWTGANCRR
jgi:hypothetical protein